MSPSTHSCRRLGACLTALAIAAAGAWSSAPAHARGKASHHVLVVAHNRSLDRGVRPLRFADDDGARYWELFSQVTPDVSLLTVLDPQTARVYPEAEQVARVPWLKELRRQVEQIARRVRAANRAGRPTTFTFVYVGHGNVDADGEGYVNLQDVRLTRSDLFREVVDPIPAGAIHLVIDACKSFFLVARGPEQRWRDDRSGRTYREEVRAFLAQGTLDSHPNVGAILSTSGDEEVHEWSAYRSGVFSHQLRSALSGAGDINGDGKIEYSEVGAFIAAANRRVVHHRARIRAFVHAPASARRAPLIDLRDVEEGLTLELGQAQQGRFFVEDDRGVRAIDLHKARGTRVRLALSRGRRYFIRYGARESIVSPDQRGLVSLDELGSTAASSVPRGSIDHAYRNDLFGVAFSRSFYEGYLASSDLPSVRFSGRPDPAPGARTELGLRLELSYGLSPTVLSVVDGVQHNLALGLRKTIWGPLQLSLQGELGISSHELAGKGAFSLLRIGIMGGVGASWGLTRWLELGGEVGGGYQGVFRTGLDRTDISPGAKFGGQAIATFRPWRRGRLEAFGIVVRAGMYGHLVREIVGNQGSGAAEARTAVHALPEGSVGISYRF